MLAELIERLEKADGPDRGLDSEVEVATGQAKYRDGKGRACYHDGRRDRVPHYTASIDAAVALAERVLPGWKWHLTDYPSAMICRDWDDDYAPVFFSYDRKLWRPPARTPFHKASPPFPKPATPAIALCIAILKAMER